MWTVNWLVGPVPSPIFWYLHEDHRPGSVFVTDNIYMCSYFNLTNYNISITLTDKEDQEVEDDNNLYHHLCAGSSSRTEHAERWEMTVLSFCGSSRAPVQFTFQFSRLLDISALCWVSRHVLNWKQNRAIFLASIFVYWNDIICIQLIMTSQVLSGLSQISMYVAMEVSYFLYQWEIIFSCG